MNIQSFINLLANGSNFARGKNGASQILGFD
jgi:hypothetical protein